MDKIMIIAFY